MRILAQTQPIRHGTLQASTFSWRCDRSPADERERGTAFGCYHLALGLSAIPAGALFGAVWYQWDAGTAFLFAGGLALCSALLLRFWSFGH